MLTVINAALLLGASLLLLPAAFLAIEVGAALLPRRPRSTTPDIARPTIGILIPAHNETAGISEVVQQARAQLRDGDRLLVVADNCSDNTAEIARGAGAEVVERTDPDNLGKGFALDFGIRHLAAAPPDVLIVLDADCFFATGSVSLLAENAMSLNRPAQAYYSMKSPPDASPTQKVSEFSWRVKNLVRPLGMSRLALPCHILGSGMAFTWGSIGSIQMASGHLVEDLKLGLDLTEKGYPPVFTPEIEVTSNFPTGADAAQTQRTRWEHGHLATIFSDVPRRLFRGLFSGNLALLGLALDAAIPPLTFFALALVLFMALSATARALGADATAFAISLWSLGLFLSAVILAWVRFGRDLLPVRTLGAVAIYILSKLPIYVRFFTKRQTKWVRTNRD